jgi:hypothetical protein
LGDKFLSLSGDPAAQYYPELLLISYLKPIAKYLAFESQTAGTKCQHSQSIAYTTQRRKNQKNRHENVILKVKEHACVEPSYLKNDTKNIPQNLVRQSL